MGFFCLKIEDCATQLNTMTWCYLNEYRKHVYGAMLSQGKMMLVYCRNGKMCTFEMQYSVDGRRLKWNEIHDTDMTAWKYVFNIEMTSCMSRADCKFVNWILLHIIRDTFSNSTKECNKTQRAYFPRNSIRNITKFLWCCCGEQNLAWLLKTLRNKQL